MTTSRAIMKICILASVLFSTCVAHHRSITSPTYKILDLCINNQMKFLTFGYMSGSKKETRLFSSHLLQASKDIATLTSNITNEDGNKAVETNRGEPNFSIKALLTKLRTLPVSNKALVSRVWLDGSWSLTLLTHCMWVLGLWGDLWYEKALIVSSPLSTT